MKKEKIPQFYVDSQTGLLSIQYNGQRFHTDWKFKKVGKSTKTSD